MSGLRLKHHCWVVVADGERALFLKNEGNSLIPISKSCASCTRKIRPHASKGRISPAAIMTGRVHTAARWMIPTGIA